MHRLTGGVSNILYVLPQIMALSVLLCYSLPNTDDMNEFCAVSRKTTHPSALLWITWTVTSPTHRLEQCSKHSSMSFVQYAQHEKIRKSVNGTKLASGLNHKWPFIFFWLFEGWFNKSAPRIYRNTSDVFSPLFLYRYRARKGEFPY